MKKTLLATAIAGAAALAATSASAATVYNQDGTKLDIYGNVQLVYTYLDQKNGDGASDLGDNGSTFGAKGEHKINDDLVGYFKAEWEYEADEAKNSGLDGGDQAYVGTKGSFGDARIGSWDPLIDDWIQDPITNIEYFGVSDSGTALNAINKDNGLREGDKIQYMSPSFGGLEFAVGSNFKGEGDDQNVTDSDQASFFAGLKYTVGGFSIAGVYDNLDQYEVSGDDPGEQYGITGQYTIDALRVALKVERFEGNGDDSDVDFYGIGTRYGYGMGDLYAAYQRVEAEGNSAYAATYDNLNGDDAEFNEFVLGGTYNISSAMYTYIEYQQYDRAADEGDGVAVGIYYGF